MLGRVLQIAVLGMLLVGVVGGGWLVAGGPLQGHAEAPVTVDGETAAEHGFSEPSVETIQFDEEIAVQGIEKRVDVSAYVMSTTGIEGEAAVFTVSLPGWTAAGLPLNPLAYVPLKQATTYVLPNLPMETPEVTWEGETTVELGGEEVTAGEYSVEGNGPDIVVARQTMSGDTVFAVGLSPDGSGSSDERISALFGDLSHG